METSFNQNKPTVRDVGFLKLFNKLKEVFGKLKAVHSPMMDNNRRLTDIYTNNTLTEDVIKKFRSAKYFLLGFIFIDAALAIPCAAFILTNIFMIPKSNPNLPILSIVSAPIFSTLLIGAGYGIIKRTISLNLERTNRKKITTTMIGGFALLLLIPIGTFLIWMSANNTQLWRVLFNIAAPAITAIGICSAVYISARFRIKYQNLEETIKEYREAKHLEDHNDDILGVAINLKKEIEVIASRFLPYVQDDSVSQINKRFSTLPLEERYILIEKIYRWRDDQIFANSEQDVVLKNYFGPDVESDEFVKFWKSI